MYRTETIVGLRDAGEIVRYCKYYQEMRDETNGKGKKRRKKMKEDLTPLHESILSLALEFRRGGIFRSSNGMPETESLRKMRKLAKYINMLGRLPSTYQKLIDFKQCYQEYTFELVFLDSPHTEELAIDVVPLRDSIKDWGGELKKQDVLESLDELIANSKNPLACSFHCELQLLKHFMKPDSKSECCLNYFGCSKASCWICWQILSAHPKYITSKTHGKIYPQCAFPFS